MKTVYIITSIEKNLVMVMQERHLKHEGTKQHSSLEVTNPHGFKIQTGSRVTIGLPQKKEAAAGILALMAPIIAAIAGYASSPFISSLLKKECTEPFKAICVSIAFILVCALVIAVSRTVPTAVKLQINSVLD